MKNFLLTLFKIIFRIHSPSIGRVPKFRDLWIDPNKELGKLAKKGLEEGMSQCNGLEPLIAIPSDFSCDALSSKLEVKHDIAENEKELKDTNTFDPRNLFCFQFHDFCNNCEHMEVRVHTAVLTGLGTKEVIRELTCERFDTCKLISEKISKDINDNHSKEGDTQ